MGNAGAKICCSSKQEYRFADAIKEDQGLLESDKWKVSSNKPKSIPIDTILKQFNDSLIKKDIKNVMAIIEEYSDSLAELLDYTLKNGDKPIHHAIRLKSSDLTYFLLQKGCDPNTQSIKTGDTPTHIATKLEDLRLLGMLIKFKANISIKNKNNQLPIDIAQKLNNIDVIDMLSTEYLNNIKTESEPMLWKPKSMEINDPDNNIESRDIENEADDDESILTDNESSDENDNNTEMKKTVNNKNNTNNMLSKLKKKKSEKILNTINKIGGNTDKLPLLGSWLQKKKNQSLTGKYHDRYLCIVDGHLLWDDKQITLQPNAKLDLTLRKKYKNALSIQMIQKVKVKKYKLSPKWWEFEIIAPNCKSDDKTTRSYFWKCKTKKLRDDWVNGIKLYKKNINKMLVKLDSYEKK